MYTISLTSIPPRYPRLGPVLRSLVNQRPAPARVILCLPRRHARFPSPAAPPALPDGVEILWHDADLGPATKVLPAARHLAGRCRRLLYCDDDWIMPPRWAATLMDAQIPGTAVTGSGFAVSRLGCQTHRDGDDPALTDIAQGFSGVLVDPEWLSSPAFDPPAAAWAVDDIWLSGILAHRKIPLRTAQAAREGMRLAFEDEHRLQDSMITGRWRHAANLACAGLLHDRYGIWPPAKAPP